MNKIVLNGGNKNGKASHKFILKYLKGKDFTSPTEIGIAWGLFRTDLLGNYHSGWASPICLKLVELGLLIRNNKGWYKLND